MVCTSSGTPHAGHGYPISLAGTTIARYAAGTVLGAALLAAVGVALGTLVRAQLGAVIGVFAWAVFVESIVGGLFNAVGPYPPPSPPPPPPPPPPPRRGPARRRGPRLLRLLLGCGTAVRRRSRARRGLGHCPLVHRQPDVAASRYRSLSRRLERACRQGPPAHRKGNDGSASRNAS